MVSCERAGWVYMYYDGLSSRNAHQLDMQRHLRLFLQRHHSSNTAGSGGES